MPGLMQLNTTLVIKRSVNFVLLALKQPLV